jgi:hypothetical protein
MFSNRLQLNISEYLLQAADGINIWHKKWYCCEYPLYWNITEQRTSMAETSNATRRKHDISQSTLLGEFEKLLKAAIRCVMSLRSSVRLFVRIVQLDSQQTDSHKILYLRDFRKSMENIQISLKSKNNTGYFT